MSSTKKIREISGRQLFIILTALLVTMGLTCCNAFVNAEELLEDQQGDLKDCYSLESSCSSCSLRSPAEERGDELPFIDIIGSSVIKTEDTDPFIVMKLKVADSVPSSTKTLTAYSFALDLDGDPNTGFRADGSPLGIFPNLGVDLWVSLSLNRGVEDSFVFIGQNNIKNLNETTGLLKYSFGQERRIVTLKIPVKPIEDKLALAHFHKNFNFEIELEKTEWVAFTSKAASFSSVDNPICDFNPDKYFEQNSEKCLLKIPD